MRQVPFQELFQNNPLVLRQSENGVRVFFSASLLLITYLTTLRTLNLLFFTESLMCHTWNSKLLKRKK